VEYELFKKRAKREEETIKEAQYYFGRTNWDRNYLELLKKDFIYFHCEEVLRPVFYNYEWKQPKQDYFKIVTVINPQLYKGLEMILETSLILKEYVKMNFEWHVIGVDNSDELTLIIEKVKGLKFFENNIFFKGVKVEKDLISELLESHVFVHPSHIDNSPNSICEAMLLGVPVIAGNVGGIPSLITHNLDGVLYNSYDPYELASIIQNIKNQALHLTNIGANGRIRAIKRHDTQKITDTVIRAYKAVIDEKKHISIM